MSYIDHGLTKKLQDWLNLEPAQRNFDEGALMMLQLNNNRILYQTVMKRPDKFMAKVEYELKKHLKIRLDNMTTQAVSQMDKELIPKVESLLGSQELAPVISSDDNQSLPPKIAKGMREDHDKLPLEIQNLWTDNGPIFFKIKELHNTLKEMHDAQPCDRYEYLKQLKDLDTQYHRNMMLYDRYDVNADHSVDSPADAPSDDDPAEFNKKVNAARTYLSDNKKKLESLRDQIETLGRDSAEAAEVVKEFDKILSKVQKRYNWLQGNGVAISDDQLIALRDLGVVIITNES